MKRGYGYWSRSLWEWEAMSKKSLLILLVIVVLPIQSMHVDYDAQLSISLIVLRDHVKIGKSSYETAWHIQDALAKAHALHAQKKEVAFSLERHVIEIKTAAKARREAAFELVKKNVASTEAFNEACDQLANAYANEEKINNFWATLEKKYEIFKSAE